jgi:hypothetical protein
MSVLFSQINKSNHMKKLFLCTFLILAFLSCEKKESTQTDTLATASAPFTWAGANIYFLLTDRFSNGNPENDVNFNRTAYQPAYCVASKGVTSAASPTK